MTSLRPKRRRRARLNSVRRCGSSSTLRIGQSTVQVCPGARSRAASAPDEARTRQRAGRRAEMHARRLPHLDPLGKDDPTPPGRSRFPTPCRPRRSWRSSDARRWAMRDSNLRPLPCEGTTGVRSRSRPFTVAAVTCANVRSGSQPFLSFRACARDRRGTRPNRNGGSATC